MNKSKIVKIVIGVEAVILLGVILFFALKKSETSITLNKEYIKMYVGSQVQIEAVTNPESDEELIWSSNNPSVANVTPNGVIVGNKAGLAVIIVRTSNEEVSNSCIVSVEDKKVDVLELDKKEAVINIGEETTINPYIVPKDLLEKVSWTSSDLNIATVDSNGKVKGISNGVAVVKAQLLDKEDTCVIYVGTKATGIKIDNTVEEIELEKTIKLNVVMQENAITEKIVWESSNPDVLTVDFEGNITAKNLGMAKITAKTEYSELTDSCYITVIKKHYEVKFSELNKSVDIVDGEALGTLPTITKSGYKLLGWYTKSTGGEKVTAATIITESMTLYPHWEKLYILPEDPNKINGFTIAANYNSETLKYKILGRGGEYYSLIWVDDAYSQFKSALAYPSGVGFLPAETILNNEINNKGYQNKGLVSVNASFTWFSDLGSPVVINDGKILRDVENKKYRENEMYPVLALKKDGTLTTYGFKYNDYSHNLTVRNQMLNDGIKDIFVISGGTDSGAKLEAHRTQICQVDKHNFVLVSGHGRVRDCGNRAKSFGCTQVYNLDGGGSRKLYYKVGSAGIVKLMGGGRPRPDMLYFVEK